MIRSLVFILTLITFVPSLVKADFPQVNLPGSKNCFCLQVQGVWALYYDDLKGGGYKLDDNQKKGFTLGECFNKGQVQYRETCYSNLDELVRYETSTQPEWYDSENKITWRYMGEGSYYEYRKVCNALFPEWRKPEIVLKKGEYLYQNPLFKSLKAFSKNEFVPWNKYPFLDEPLLVTDASSERYDNQFKMFWIHNTQIYNILLARAPLFPDKFNELVNAGQIAFGAWENEGYRSKIDIVNRNEKLSLACIKFEKK